MQEDIKMNKLYVESELLKPTMHIISKEKKIFSKCPYLIFIFELLFNKKGSKMKKLVIVALVGMSVLSAESNLDLCYGAVAYIEDIKYEDITNDSYLNLSSFNKDGVKEKSLIVNAEDIYRHYYDYNASSTIVIERMKKNQKLKRKQDLKKKKLII